MLSSINAQIEREAHELSDLDVAGINWSKKNYPNGFTSYASMNVLQRRSTTFEKLEKQIDQHVKKFVKALEMDLGGGVLKMSTCWVNVMKKNTYHGTHIHPLSVISGTYYVKIPKGASPIKFEDPRLSRMMAAPPKKSKVSDKNNLFVSLDPREGDVVLFESWIPHEVPIYKGNSERISISFNYEWA